MTQNWDDITDEELLAEVHRRFGETWCSFSSGVRARGECPVCHREIKLTRHHLVPVAADAGRSIEVRRRYVKICADCHRLTHQHWGPGNSYEGPQDRDIFVKRLTEVYREGPPHPPV